MKVIPWFHNSLPHPYLTEQLKRFGDFVLDLETVSVPFEQAIQLPIKFDEI
ncbi:hypothetical protein AM10699_62600 (plasmid) [Acaryochloris marina MBIC10699]|nr:hypothetical protein AM10699_62600 [Acaryochloris marina MBIC10699]